jgi:hypothetical protein
MAQNGPWDHVRSAVTVDPYIFFYMLAPFGRGPTRSRKWLKTPNLDSQPNSAARRRISAGKWLAPP